MKLKFLGLKKQQKKTGCSACGKRVASSFNFERTKKLVLPSGQIKMFVAGTVYDVSEADGQFLLTQTYSLNGKQENMFVGA